MCVCMFTHVNYSKLVKDAINCLCYYYVFVCTTNKDNSLLIIPRTERALSIFSMRNLAVKKEMFGLLIFKEKLFI